MTINNAFQIKFESIIILQIINKAKALPIDRHVVELEHKALKL